MLSVAYSNAGSLCFVAEAISVCLMLHNVTAKRGCPRWPAWSIRLSASLIILQDSDMVGLDGVSHPDSTWETRGSISMGR